MINSYALQKVCRLNELIKIQLLRHGNCDGGGSSKDEFGNDLRRDQTRRAFLQFIVQGTIQRLCEV